MKSEFEKEMFEYSKLRRAEDMFLDKTFWCNIFCQRPEKRQKIISQKIFSRQKHFKMSMHSHHREKVLNFSLSIFLVEITKILHNFYILSCAIQIESDCFQLVSIFVAKYITLNECITLVKPMRIQLSKKFFLSGVLKKQKKFQSFIPMPLICFYW